MRLDLVIANKNAPRQCVLSGPVGGDRRGPRGVRPSGGSRPGRSPVSAAFHSRFVADARGPFREALDAVEFAPARRSRSSPTRPPRPIPTTPTRPATCSPASSPGRSSSSPRSRRCTGSGVRTFLEVGPDAQAHRPGRRDPRRPRPRRARRRRLARRSGATSSTWPARWRNSPRSGYPVRPDPLGRRAERLRQRRPRKPGLTVKVCGANAAPRAAPPRGRRPCPSPPAPRLRPSAIHAARHRSDAPHRLQPRRPRRRPTER